ncbi:MAG: bifunctional phosphopantothenoylcysteine decarboxylase/phosphopantothenate--cysteine ligase CoaBC [Rickettsiales bacterium]|nr:bifunctional phosphopantothenoylcysteine decarboxylase/phosphopantothenate--cysteine ligase CoaBC [Rickettsiales bacterium]
MISRVLLIISGSVASYKALELIRLMQKKAIEVNVILTSGGAQFITPLAVSALTGRPTYTDLWSLKDETEMGHIRLSREADIIIVAPASADLMAKMAQGRADDLASATLLASDKPVYVAPAMNAKMWQHPATQRNLAQLQNDGVRVIAPAHGEMACGEIGDGRMADPQTILNVLLDHQTERALSGRHVIITAGPTYEPIDPVRFLGNRSSGKQGYAIAAVLVAHGAQVTLVSGPTSLADVAGANCVRVETAAQMHEAVQSALPADVFIATAAVADWRPTNVSPRKLKKRGNAEPPALELSENPDILASVSRHANRPALVIGFAAETEELPVHAEDKRQRKQLDWVLANDVSGGAVFGEDVTSLVVISDEETEHWSHISKRDAAERLAQKITLFFDTQKLPRAPSARIIEL